MNYGNRFKTYNHCFDESFWPTAFIFQLFRHRSVFTLIPSSTLSALLQQPFSVSLIQLYILSGSAAAGDVAGAAAGACPSAAGWGKDSLTADVIYCTFIHYSDMI